jgi:tetratricopeptide (TPR) repeat protein
MTNTLAKLDPTNQNAYDGLVVSIEALQGKMGIIFAICDSHELQLEIIYRYEQELSSHIRPYRIEIPPSEPNIRWMISNLIDNEEYLRAGGATVVSVLGSEKISSFKSATSFDDDQRSNLQKWFGYLQWTREAFREFKFPIILWVNSYIVKNLMRQAPDFWSWRQDVFEFKRASISINDQATAFAEHLTDRKNNSSALAIPANELLEIIKSLEAEDPDNSLLGSIYLRTGQAFYQQAIDDYTIDHLANIELSKDYFRRGIARLKHGDFIESANAYCDLAAVHILQNEYITAQDLYDQALKIYRENADSLGEASTLKAIGDIQRRLYKNTEALDNYQSAIEIYYKLGNRLGAANTLKAIGDVLQFKKQTDEALDKYSQAFNIYEQVGARLGAANTLQAIGHVYFHHNQLVPAMEQYQKALSIFSTIQDGYSTGAAWFYIARTRAKQGNIPEAKQAYRRAQKLFQEINLPEFVAICEQKITEIKK